MTNDETVGELRARLADELAVERGRLAAALAATPVPGTGKRPVLHGLHLAEIDAYFDGLAGVALSAEPGPFAIRRALGAALTLAGVDELLGWASGTAAKTRHRADFPEPDALVGRTPVWARTTIEQWRDSRPGQGRRTDLTRTETST